MFEKVLVSMDLSPATEALVSALPGMRELGTREFVLVHVAKPSRGPTSEGADPSGRSCAAGCRAWRTAWKRMDSRQASVFLPVHRPQKW